ncbi:hypothetical protein MLD38_038906 [Melastoma candidum]|uniref:Uncharacterized protein n=1 Tax=Melastoma candidum TaxID=119954 RepID=A0ACB9L0M9_9MYRT|nr:hypothetical protein MLD38_038906 [Melastoma candidum]
MASNSPLEMEDQTDEDFFDKLVDDDDFGVSKLPDSTHTFDRLSVNGERQGGGFEVKMEAKETDAGTGVLHDAEASSSMRNSCAVGESTFYDNKAQESAVDSLDGEKKVQEIVEDESKVYGCMVLGDIDDGDDGVPVESCAGGQETGGIVGGISKKGSGGSSRGIKEVGWSSFYADSGDQGGNQDNGSYSDFFSGFNNVGADGEFSGSVGNQSYNTRFTSSGVESQSSGLESSVNYGHLNGEPTDVVGQGQNADLQDLSSSNYWESMYPGWTYDATTGQWYPIVGYDSNANLQSESGNAGIENWTSTSNDTTEVSYLQQSVQSIAGTMEEAGMTENVYSANQVADGNAAYPEHIVFDSQYPGWYYDMIKQEWCTIESYTASIQSTIHTQNQQQVPVIADAVHSQNDTYSDYWQTNTYGLQKDATQVHDDHRAGSYDGHNQQSVTSSWHTGTFSGNKAVAWGGNRQSGGFASEFTASDNLNRHSAVSSFPNLESYDKPNERLREVHKPLALGNFIQDPQYNQPIQQAKEVHCSNEFYSSQMTASYGMQPFESVPQFSQMHSSGRSSAGRPAHALVAFGFGGKLIVMQGISSGCSLSNGGQDSSGCPISVLNLSEVLQKNGENIRACSYTRALCQHSLPGPLVGGSVSNKDLNKWIDERIAGCDSPDVDYNKAENLKILLSLLKISCQHYGKLRSPFGSETALKEGDSPESAVAKLFTSAKKTNSDLNSYSFMSCCFQFLPAAEQIQATAFEVQSLLVSGRKKEALQCAQAGQLWGPALILASQLGEQFYVDTVKQMALKQMVPGSPLRTLCLLIAGQPAEVFNAKAAPGMHASGMVSQNHVQSETNGMLEDWEDNLAIITVNRTKDDELVIIHLGDCLWKEKGEITAAHICYLVAEANFESYSDTARMCIISGDHWKCPRTYASPEAIQRTELYEYSKVLGNSQFTLQPFQPYKIIYAHMLAEVGRISDSLKYCQAISKSIKNGRTPEMELWKQVISSLEERIRMHQQGGYSANLAPGKIVGKLLNFIDNTAHRVVGGLPPPVPMTTQAGTHAMEQFHQPLVTKVSGSQSTMAMSSLIPSNSMEPVNEWSGNDNGRMRVYNRSVSEPNFGRTPKQGDGDSSNNMNSENAQAKASVSGRSSHFTRFGFGSQLLQKTVGLVLRPRNDKQAKLGESNKFYYDEKLKRWVEEGAEPPAEETALAPPPTTAAFQNGLPDCNLRSSIKSEGTLPNGSPEFISPFVSEHSLGIPPIPPSLNQFSARGRMGVRSRYVDTFNQGGGSPAKLFQSQSVPAAKPAVAANAKFFIPTPIVSSSSDQTMESIAENSQEETATSEDTFNQGGGSPAKLFQSQSVPAAKPAVAANAKFFIPTPIVSSSSDQTMESIAENLQEETATSEDFSVKTVPYKYPLVSASSNMPRFPSMGNIPSKSTTAGENGSLPLQSRRNASWSGSFNEASFPPKHAPEVKPLGEGLGLSPSSMMQMHTNGGGLSDELDEVEL